MLALGFYGLMFAMLFYGGDVVAEATDSRWLAALGGLLAGLFLATTLFLINRLPAPAGIPDGQADHIVPPPEEEERQFGDFTIIVVISLALLIFSSSFGYSGTSFAFEGVLLLGFLLGTLAFERKSLNSGPVA